MRERFRFKKLLEILKTREFRHALFRFRVAAGIEHVAVLKQLSYRTVVDVGANRGQFALAARYCSPAATIYSFEPLPHPAAIYRNVFAQDSNIQLFETAIGAESGAAEIHISRRDDSSSLLPIGQRQEALFPGTGESGVLAIEICRLSDRVSSSDLKGPAILKLDVQGYELQVLQGCGNLIDRFQWVYVECSFLELYEGQALAHQVIDWLTQFGFTLCGVYNMTYDSTGQAVQADFLFQHAAI